MIKLKTAEDIQLLREGGRRLARVLREVSAAVRPGVETHELNELAERLIRAGGDEPSFLGYRPTFASRPFPAAICISVNDEIVHGIPTENNRTLQEGDIVGLDCGLTHRGRIVDAAVTVGVGSIDEAAQELLAATKHALLAGVHAAKPGKRIGDISDAIETVGRKADYGIVYELGGHGVGYHVHEDPMVPNVGDPGTGPKLEENLVLALEPMFNEGTEDVVLAPDGYTYRTADGKRSAHFEHTIVITKKGAEILTA